MEHSCRRRCVAQELDRVLGHASYGRVIYVGDGRGDFCPVRVLRGQLEA